MKQTTDNLFCDLIGEHIQIILTRPIHPYDPGGDKTESIWSEGVVRGAYIARGVPMFLLEKGGMIKLSAFDESHGRMHIRLVPPEPPA